MVLTYRSSIPTTITITRQDSDGRTRKGTAVRHDGDQHWQLRDELPSGEKFDRSFYGDKNEAGLALATHMAQHEIEYVQSGQRGDRPRQTMLHDRSVALSAAPIVASERFSTPPRR